MRTGRLGVNPVEARRWPYAPIPEYRNEPSYSALGSESSSVVFSLFFSSVNHFKRDTAHSEDSEDEVGLADIAESGSSGRRYQCAEEVTRRKSGISSFGLLAQARIFMARCTRLVNLIQGRLLQVCLSEADRQTNRRRSTLAMTPPEIKRRSARISHSDPSHVHPCWNRRMSLALSNLYGHGKSYFRVQYTSKWALSDSINEAESSIFMFYGLILLYS
ncbi:unnamed protein product [Protopolystoma xenopodis]|uniref:Uncharacterized protein n=1 Tax=Protopolystoma xenopodis TaxID=117903 RepID=A0A3S5FHD5_9PLAT|nr:unnamed protein product [Protopolystoma xenopodis]